MINQPIDNDEENNQQIIKENKEKAEKYNKEIEDDKQKKLLKLQQIDKERKKKEKEKEERDFREWYENRIDITNIYVPKEKYIEGKFYDAVIKVNLLNELIKNGWDIFFSNEGYEQYNKYKTKLIIPISVIGESNKGKSYLLGKICNIDIPKGFTEKTEGISFKYFKSDQLTCGLIDTAGGETPITSNDENN